jgi:hypothetical protein
VPAVDDRFTESGTTIGEIDFWCKLYMLRGSLPELAGMTASIRACFDV